MSGKQSISESLYDWTRHLHLYFGLFISPFIIVFAISTIRLNHGWNAVPQETVSTVPIQPDESLEGMELVAYLARQLDLKGEIVGNGVVRNNQTTLLVARPGITRIARINLETGEAELTVRRFGLLGTLRYLHMNPGPHKPTKWIIGRLWGWLADATVYLTLFLTVSGIYMWAVLRAERKAGLLAVGTGVLSFTAILLALLF